MIARKSVGGGEWIPVFYDVRVILRDGKELHLPKVTLPVQIKSGIGGSSDISITFDEGVYGKAVFYERDVAAYIMRVKT